MANGENETFHALSDRYFYLIFFLTSIVRQIPIGKSERRFWNMAMHSNEFVVMRKKNINFVSVNLLFLFLDLRFFFIHRQL